MQAALNDREERRVTMLDLPLKEQELEVKAMGVTFRVATLTEEQLYRVLDERPGRVIRALENGNVELSLRLRRDEFARTFAETVRSADLTIAGQPFDPTNEAHLLAVKPGMKAGCVQEQVHYEMTLPKAVRGNSKAPVAPSRKASTPDADSAGASSDS